MFDEADVADLRPGRHRHAPALNPAVVARCCSAVGGRGERRGGAGPTPGRRGGQRLPAPGRRRRRRRRRGGAGGRAPAYGGGTGRVGVRRGGRRRPEDRSAGTARGGPGAGAAGVTRRWAATSSTTPPTTSGEQHGDAPTRIAATPLGRVPARPGSSRRSWSAVGAEHVVAGARRSRPIGRPRRAASAVSYEGPSAAVEVDLVALDRRAATSSTSGGSSSPRS